MWFETSPQCEGFFIALLCYLVLRKGARIMEVDHSLTWTLENLGQVPGVKEPEAVIINQSGVPDSRQTAGNPYEPFSNVKVCCFHRKRVCQKRPWGHKNGWNLIEYPAVHFCAYLLDVLDIRKCNGIVSICSQKKLYLFLSIAVTTVFLYGLVKNYLYFR